MDPRRVPFLLGKIGTHRGRTNEERVLHACRLASRPPWMKSARRATRAEDHDGIDVVVESDVGKLYVQVKSSRRGKAEFQERRRRARVAVVVVGSGDAPEKILARVVGQLAPLRAEYLRQRGPVD
jgi:hypothetical protein